jgi:hypothetical protein
MRRVFSRGRQVEDSKTGYRKSALPVVLVVGVMRSGTTLLARDVSSKILGSPTLPEVTPLSEIALATAKWRDYESSRYGTWIRSDERISELLVAAYDSFVSSGIESMSPDELGQAQGICLKDPELALCIEEVLCIAARRDMSLVVIIRHPIAVVASAYGVLMKRDGSVDIDWLEQHIWHAFAGIERILAAQERGEASVFVVRYEDYCVDPDRALHAIAEHVGIPMRQKRGEQVSRLDRSDPFHSPLLLSSVSADRIDSWVSELPVDLSSRFSSTFSGVISRLGYDAV